MKAAATSDRPEGETPPGFREALGFWVKLGFISFGGPAGQIAIMHDELVKRRRWIEADRFLHALNFCMLLPGPEAQQLAIYCGWLLHGRRGAIAGGVFFVLPSAILLWGLSWLYVTHGQTEMMTGIFLGLKPAVLAIIVVALIRISWKTLVVKWLWVIAGGAFLAICFLGVPFPLIILAAAFGGALLEAKGGPSQNSGPKALDAPRKIRAGRLMAVTGLLWSAPVLASWLALGFDHPVTQAGLFFSKAAMVTFGGAYAVLPYVAQQAVERHGWLTAAQMLDGLGLAETTPGPLVIVLEYAGFMGGWNHPGALPRLLSATLAAAMTVWVTFVPCFLWVLLGAPHVERLREKPWIQNGLRGITAAVVGVILNLAVWFGGGVLIREGAVDGFSVTLAAVVTVGLWRWRWPVHWVVLGSAGMGHVYQLFNIR